jgi:Adenylate and Guanylate cyclase catalytic domain
VSVLGGLSVLRRDAEVLVLGPLRRMLKIVARYAKNPLMPATKIKRRRPIAASFNKRRSVSGGDNHSDGSSSDSDDDDSDNDDVVYGGSDALGSYETEQLITAVTKITDLLRKCWGVAGADIISTNLDSQEGLKHVFNPTVAGKKVYALFAFAAITEFAHAQRTLGGNVMILINHVAGVVHDEVFRWGFGDSGACNKNLGAAFLLVFRIGLVSEVQNKLKQAKDVLFNHGPKASQATKRPKKALTASIDNSTALSHSSTSSTSMATNLKRSSIRINNNIGGKGVGASPTHGRRKSLAGASKRLSGAGSSFSASAALEKGTMSLASLPGINAFTDRAVIGMLKSYAGIHRDKKIRDWNNSFELSAGVGAFTVSMIYGMDAGWAMEGAVGSEYKIDATYLSPHVNMASRMMSACKQYGVSILLSQAVQELMSDVARSKLRHLDTVTVKGSSVKQKIYTYDARHKGVDFFLYSKTDAQADEDANKYYETKIWNMDQDLKAMRQHVTEEFLKEFASGRKAYLSGDWPVAMKRLERANEIMVETALEEGYLEDEFNVVFAQQQSISSRDAGAGGDAARAAAEELKVKNGDGPSLYLLNFMKSHGGVAPDRWEGWHPLLQK